MVDIKRWAMVDDTYWGGSTMRTHRDGDFVLYEDHLAAIIGARPAMTAMQPPALLNAIRALVSPLQFAAISEVFREHTTEQPPAMHDELRARILDALNLYYALGQNGEPSYSAEAADRIAALSLPASAVAWQVRYRAFDDCEWQFCSKKAADEANGRDDWETRALYTTPPPPPAAHAGGEAVPVDALREYIAELREQAKKLRNEIPNLRDGTDKRFHSAQDADLVADELTALLSGGAAREEK